MLFRSVYNKGDNDDILNNMKELYDQGDEGIFKRCRLFKIIAKCRHDEIENVVGSKGKTRLEYTNDVREYAVTNYEMEILKMYDVSIHEFITVVEWENQCPQFKRLMRDLSKMKQNATDPLMKANAKLLANACYGSMNQKDKLEKLLFMYNSDDLHKVYDEYPTGIKNKRDCGDYIFGIVENTESDCMVKPCYIGAFTLGGSKKLLYSTLFIAMGGIERMFDFDNMPGYGDTDSVTLHRKCIKRLTDYDSTRDVKDRLLFNAGDNEDFKAGKLTDELSDDIAKYFGREYVENIDRSFPNFYTEYTVRIIECFTPQSKSGAFMFISPPTHWKDGRKTNKNDYPQPNEEAWVVGYKCFAKGVTKDSILTMNKIEYGEIDLEKCDRIQIVIENGVEKYMLKGMKHDKSTYEFMKYSCMWSLPIKTKREEKIVRKILIGNDKTMENGIGFGDIINDEDSGRTIWGYIDNGRIPIMRSGFEGKSIAEWSREGVDIFTCSTGYSVPTGYRFEEME